MIGEEALDRLFALDALERTDRIDEGAAGLQPLRRSCKKARLESRIAGDHLRPRAIEYLGVPAERAGRGARRVEKDRIEGAARLPLQRIGFDQLRRQVGPGEILAQSSETTCGRIHGC